MNKPFIFDHPINIRETLFQDRFFLLTVGIVGVLSFLFVSLGDPPGLGVDFMSYIRAYCDVGDARLFRPVGVSYVIGLIASMSYSYYKAALLVIYLIYLLAVYYATRIFGIVEARIITLVILLHFEVNMLFHHLGGDNLMVLGVALWTALVVRLYKIRTASVSIILALATLGLVQIRPTGVLFCMIGVYPLVCYGLTLRNMLNSMVFFLTFFAAIFGVYGSSPIQGGETNASLPGFHLFMVTELFSKDNGPASQALFHLVETELLTKPPYTDYNVDIDTFFSARSDVRMFSDLVYVDFMFQEGIVRKAALEAIIKHPGAFLKSWTNKFFFLLTHSYGFNTVGVTNSSESLPSKISDQHDIQQPPTQTNRKLKIGERIPYSYSSGKEIVEKMRKKSFNTDTPPANLESSSAALLKDLSDRVAQYAKLEGSYQPGLFTSYFLAKIVPPMFFFFIVSFLLIFHVRWLEIRLLFLMFVPAFGVVLVSSLFTSAYESAVRYRMPYVFLFVMIGVAGLFGNRTFRNLFRPDKESSAHVAKKMGL